MREAKLKYKRQQIIYNFIHQRAGGALELLDKINNDISEIDPSKQIGLRTLQKQIKELKEKHGWPIIKDSGIFQFNEDFDYQELRKDEKNIINEAMLILERFDGKLGFEWLDEIDMDSFNINFVNNSIQYEESTSPMKYFIKFKNSIFNKNVLIVKRKILRENKEIQLSIEFHPHFLKKWNSKWYVFGLKKDLDKNEKGEKESYVIPIDIYINDVKETRETFIESKINYSKSFENDYFLDIIGVTNYLDRNPVEVMLKIHSKERFRIINSKPPHWSRSIIQEDDEFTKVSMLLKLNNELENFLLHFTPDIEILSPPELKQKIKEKLKLGLKRNTN